MRKSVTIAGAASMLAGLIAISPLYAEETKKPSGSDMGSGMMNDGGMMGMMNMMQQMGQMMELCNKMMQSSIDKDKPQKNAPAAPGKSG